MRDRVRPRLQRHPSRANGERGHQHLLRGLMAVSTVLAAPAQTAPGAQGGRGAATPAPSATADGEFTIRPPWSSAPETIYDNNIPHGMIHRFTMKSAESKIYKGIARGQPGGGALRTARGGLHSRAVRAGNAGAVHRGAGWVQRQVSQHGADRARQADRREDACRSCSRSSCSTAAATVQAASAASNTTPSRPPIRTFIETEVLPRIERDYKVTFTTDPEGRATMGGSSGAAAAFTMAWFHPELLPAGAELLGHVRRAGAHRVAPRGAWEYHATFIPNSEKKPIRVWMQVAEFDNGATRDEASPATGCWPTSGWRRR